VATQALARTSAASVWSAIIWHSRQTHLQLMLVGLAA
jgi:hypothetical protein